MVGSKARDHRDVGGVAPAGDQDATNPWLIMSGVEGEPSIAEKDFEPGVEIHWRRVWRNADVAKLTVAVAGRNVEATAQSDRQMSEVAADADALG